MPSKDQQQVDSSELLADINYLNQANKKEIRCIKSSIRQRIAAVGDSDDVRESIINEVSSELGRLRVAVKLTEKALSSISGPGTIVDKGESHFSGLRIPASQLAGTENFFPLESMGEDKFCWSSSEPEIDFSFVLDRREVLEMQIHLFCLIKSEHSRRMKIFIDDQHVKHWFAPLGSKIVVGCRLPLAGKSTQTDVKIVLPGTHSPSEISNSTDTRKLGIAISEIRFDKPVGTLTRLQMRLRMKK